MLPSVFLRLFISIYRGSRKSLTLYFLSVLGFSAIAAFDSYIIYLLGTRYSTIIHQNLIIIVVIVLAISVPLRFWVNKILMGSSSLISFFIANSNFSSFLDKSYQEQSSTSSGKVIVNSNDIPNQINSLILQPFAQLIISCSTIFFLAITVYRLIGGLVFVPLLLLGCLYYYYLKMFQPKLQANSTKIKESLSSINDIINNFGSNLEAINMHRLSNNYLELFRAQNYINKTSICNNTIILNSPKIVLDGLIIALLFVSTLGVDFFELTSINSNSIIALLFSFSKIFPASQSVARLYSTLTSAIPFLNSCYLGSSISLFNLTSYEDETDVAPINNISLKIRDIVLPWGNNINPDSSDTILKKSEFHSGQPNIITGPSGCGKSTLLLILSGLVKPKEGFIEYYDYDSGEKLQKSNFIDFIPQHPGLLTGSTYFNVTLSSNFLDGNQDTNFSENLNSVNLGYLDSLLQPINLSGGEKYRLSIARSLYLARPILLLDEPFAALDVHNIDIIYNQLLAFSRNNLLIIVSHAFPDFVLKTSRIYTFS